MTSPRAQLATDLAAALSAWKIIGYGRAIDRVDQRTAMVYAREWTTTPATARALAVDIDVWIFSEHQDPKLFTDDIEDALVELVAALRPLTYVQFRGATFDIWGDQQLPGYRVTTTAVALIELETTP